MKNVIYVMIAIMLVIIIWLISTQKESKFNTIKLYNTNQIYSRQVPEYLDTIVNLGLEQLNIKNTIIVIKPISVTAKSNFGFGTLKAYIIGKNGQYIIWIDELGRSESIKVLSHELIHLQQYESKRLIIYNNNAIWMGDTSDVNSIPYNDRPWEIEAFSKQSKLNNTLSDILYK